MQQVTMALRSSAAYLSTERSNIKVGPFPIWHDPGTCLGESGLLLGNLWQATRLPVASGGCAETNLGFPSESFLKNSLLWSKPLPTII